MISSFIPPNFKGLINLIAYFFESGHYYIPIIDYNQDRYIRYPKHVYSSKII